MEQHSAYNPDAFFSQVEEKNVFANIHPKPDIAKTLYITYSTKLEKYGAQRYRITLLDLAIRKAPF